MEVYVLVWVNLSKNLKKSSGSSQESAEMGLETDGCCGTGLGNKANGAG